MRLSIFAKPLTLSQANRRLLSVFCCFLVITVLWLGVRLDNQSMVLAKPATVSSMATLQGAIASRPNVLENLRDKVKDDLGEKADSEKSQPSLYDLENKNSRSDKGQPKRTFDNSAKKIESTGNEVDGRTEENVAKIQGKDTNPGDRVENAIENVMSNIQDKGNN